MTNQKSEKILASFAAGQNVTKPNREAVDIPLGGMFRSAETKKPTALANLF